MKQSLIFKHFCRIRSEDQISDHTTLCRFLNEIVTKKIYDSY
ncbi:MAG: transposase [Flavobacteriales bacterium Tduv]